MSEQESTMTPKRPRISSAISQSVPKPPSKLAKKAGKRVPKEPVIHEDPRQELRRLVAMHKNWTQTAKAWDQSIHDITTKEGVVVKCTKPEHIREDLDRTCKALKAEASRLEAAMMVQLKQIPIYTVFLQHVYGFGPVVSAYICAMVRPERCVKVSQLWRYCGNACRPTGEREVRKTGDAPKYAPDGSMTGASGTYNAELKMRIYQGFSAMYKNAAKLTKDRPLGTDSKYLERWDNATHSRKAAGREKNAFHTGRRKATDLFLEDLYILWRTLENLPVWPDLYSVRRGYFHGGKPCVNEGRVLTLEEALDVVGDFKPRASKSLRKAEVEDDAAVTA